jgi:hypothetical protein
LSRALARPFQSKRRRVESRRRRVESRRWRLKAGAVELRAGAGELKAGPSELKASMKFTVLAQNNEIPETQHDLDSRTVLVDIIIT